ncbi:hypothetical protein C8F01DRAFT_676674 [Mycena amicta]|nr:hypothetical protein C8F01DRAFT_676674 [Mycena amicta]
MPPTPYILFVALASLIGSTIAISNVHVQLDSQVETAGRATISWDSDASDSLPMTLALFSSVASSGAVVLADDVNPQDNWITMVLPQIEPGSYIVSFLSTSSPKSKRSPTVLTSSSPFFISVPAGPRAIAPPVSPTRSTEPASSRTTPPASRSLSALSSSVSAAASTLSLPSQFSSLSSAASSALSAILSDASEVSSAQSVSATSTATQNPSAGTSVRANGLRSGLAGGLGAMVVGLVLGALVL